VTDQSEARVPVSDLDIHEAVTHAIERLTIVRESGALIDVTVEEGVVTLTGLIFTEIMRRMILGNVSLAPGVRRIVDRLYSDSRLQVAVAQALALDPIVGARQPDIPVTSYHGVVSLSGAVQSELERHAAVAAVRNVPGVRAVVDKLAVLAGAAS